MWGDSSELKSKNIKVSGLDVLHIRNQLTLNDDFFVFEESYVDTVHVM